MTIVFDFDKTLTDNDTILPFFLFCSKRKVTKRLYIGIYFLLKVLSKLHFISVRKEKEIGLRLFCPPDINDFKRYCFLFSNQIKLNNIYYSEYLWHKNAGNKLIVASASFQYYLELLFPDAISIGTTLKVDSSGKIVCIERHPFRQEKSKVLEENEFGMFDLFYTDSKNDISTTSLSKKTYWIKDGKIVN